MAVRRSGREIRAAVRAQLEAQLQAREEAALSVASAWDKVARAAERLAAVESEASAVVAAANKVVSVTDLSALADVPADELRRLLRASRASAGQLDSDVVADEAEGATEDAAVDAAVDGIGAGGVHGDRRAEEVVVGGPVGLAAEEGEPEVPGGAGAGTAAGADGSSAGAVPGGRGQPVLAGPPPVVT